MMQEDLKIFRYAELRSTELELASKLLLFAQEKLGAGFIDDAWDDFNDYANEDGFDPENLLSFAFTPWMLYSWPLNAETAYGTEGRVPEDKLITLASLYRAEGFADPMETQLILSATRRAFSVYEVLEKDSAGTITLRDLFRDSTSTIMDPRGVESVRVGSGIMARVCKWSDGTGFTVGHFPLIIRPENIDRVKALQNELKNELEKDPLDEAALLHGESLAIAGFLKIIDEQLEELDILETVELAHDAG